MKKSIKNTKKSTPKVENTKKIWQDKHKASYADLARAVMNGEIEGDWKYVLRRRGYNWRAVEVLINGYNK